MKSILDNCVRIVEVGLRDGLQNESTSVSLEIRHELLLKLVHSGIKTLEVGSFVSPKWVPAMEPSEALFARAFADLRLKNIPENTVLSGLVPNEKGMERALQLGLKEIALFAACTESFSLKNINCSMEESFKRIGKVAKIAFDNGIRIRAYLSTCFGCPFEGPVDLMTVRENVQRMIDIGAYEVSLGDTIGLASAGDVEKLLEFLFTKISPHVLAGHFHDTRGQAVANVLKAYQMGIKVFDASIGGLGGCPYAPGATGNVATEDIVYLFESMNVDTGVNLSYLLEINQWLAKSIQKVLPSKVGLADGLKNHKFGVCFL